MFYVTKMFFKKGPLGLLVGQDNKQSFSSFCWIKPFSQQCTLEVLLVQNHMCSLVCYVSFQKQWKKHGKNSSRKGGTKWVISERASIYFNVLYIYGMFFIHLLLYFYYAYARFPFPRSTPCPLFSFYSALWRGKAFEQILWTDMRYKWGNK